MRTTGKDGLITEIQLHLESLQNIIEETAYDIGRLCEETGYDYLGYIGENAGKEIVNNFLYPKAWCPKMTRKILRDLLNK